jgi:sugar lactone lactonase YvrE
LARPISRAHHPLAGRRLLIGALALLAAACASTGTPEETEYVFYPNLPETPRIQHLVSFGSEWSARGRIDWLEEFLYGAAPPIRLMKPYGVAIHDGKVFVVDTIAAAVGILDLADHSSKSLGVKGPGRLLKPINIAVDEDGTRYVTDRKLARVLVYDAENRYVTAFGDPEVWAPTDVAIGGEELYVADRQNGEIFVLDKRSGEELRRLGGAGVEVAEFLFPTNLALDGEGNLYVSDTLNYRIQKVDPEGRPLQQFGEAGDGLGQFARPKGIAVDRENRLYPGSGGRQSRGHVPARKGRDRLRQRGPLCRPGGSRIRGGIPDPGDQPVWPEQGQRLWIPETGCRRIAQRADLWGPGIARSVYM